MKKRYIATAAALFSIVAAAYAFWQNNGISVSHYTYTCNKVKSDLDGFKIVHVSDLHGKSFGESNRRLLSYIRREQPDMIVISGDIADERGNEFVRSEGINTAISFVEKASMVAPVYYAAGNHEYALSLEEQKRLFTGISDAGGVILDNDTLKFDCGSEKLYISGLSDREASEGALRRLLADTSDGLSILISHRPQFGQNYAEAGADLTFSGHAHGGQIRLPFFGGLYAPDQGLFPEFTEGIHYFGQSATVISRGLGSSRFPVRINNMPELVVVTLSRSFVD